VLDEPNSNLDGAGEAALTSAILGVRARGGVVVVVAHQPSALAGVDLLLVMGQGRQRAFGPKTEILRELQRAATTPLPAVQPAPMKTGEMPTVATL
jgi:ABC-type protease/lipase transport system fused ATPase/permease subunit